MASGPYSFIDIAVLEEVRGRFAAGDALAILSIDLDEVIWANGPGAALFGYPDIEAVMGAAPGLSFAARRQISAVPGFPRMGRDRSVVVRLASGTTSRAVPFLVSAVTLPDGVPAILLALPASAPEGRSGEDAAARIIGGFKEAGYYAALVDAEGQVSAASQGFADLAISQETLSRLVAEVAHESDRLVKRLVPAGRRLIPAGIARLTDSPALHLLIAIDASIEETEEDAGAEASTPSTDPAHADEPAPSRVDLPERIEEDLDAEAAEADEAQEAAADTPSSGDGEVRQGDAAASPAPPPDRASDPVRFAWRTDAEGAFSAVSEEFVLAVGLHAADIVGKTFPQIAAALDLDPEGEIAGLLERRDTWSGRSVLWPVAGTGLVVPVDLAALPAYDRDRAFEGFRGFGVARMGDAIADPSALGLKLAAGLDAHEAGAEQTAHAQDGESSPASAIEDEKPAFPAPLARQAGEDAGDKIISLDEHRQQAATSQLSASERNAFEEIRERLRKDYEDRRDDQPAPALTEEPADQTEEDVRGRSVPDDEFDTEAGAADQTGDAANAEDDAADSVEEEPARGEAVSTPVGAGDETIPDPHSPARPAPPIATAGFLPSAFAPDGGRAQIDPELIAGLPLPLLVHAGDELYFANRDFLALTGHDSLDQLRSEGGLDSLFVDQAPDAQAGPHGRKLVLRTRAGDEFAVDAHLQSIRWRQGAALLLSLRRAEPSAGEPAPAPAGEPAQPEDEQAAHIQLERRVAEMRTIIDTATDGVVLIANDGTIRNISRPAEALFGHDSAEVEGKPFASLFAIESRRAASDYLAGLSENGVASVLNDGREVIGREAEGRFIPLFMTIGRLPGESGFCAVVRDITQWKRAEEELTQARARAERASSQKTEFLARVSHEIRTPLNAIIGFSELMMDEKFGPVGSDRYRDYLRDINRSGNHVLDLVNDLLDISKIEAGEHEMHYEAVSLNDALSEAVAMMQPQANRERVIIRSSFASRLPDVVADLRSVRQIALNLLSNAIRYTLAGGQVIVSTSYEASGDVVMRVRDTGIGMSLSEIDQALKPFKQINALRRGRHEGTGLGLPLTKAMVEANRARFSITSTPGEGTMVEITFPATRVLAA